MIAMQKFTGARALRTACLYALHAALVAPLAAHAVEAPASSGAALEEVTVTAQRRTEAAQDVPIAIAAFSASELERRGIQSTVDVARYVPNLVGHNNTALSSANSYFIRGIGNTESLATFDPSVGTYVDDIYIARQNANNFSFFDVERIEVLRGPQGTLFGRNTSGGAINVLLRKPSESFALSGEVGMGRFDAWEARSTLDVPLSPRLLTQVAGFYRVRDGYVRNTTTGANLNGAEEYGARVALAMPLADTVRWDASAHYLSFKGENLVNFECDPANPSVCNGRYATTGLLTKLGDGERQFPGLVLNATGIGPQPASLADGKDFLPLGADTKSVIVASNLQFAVGAATLNAITGYVRLEQDFVLDFSDGRGAPSVAVLNPPVARLRAGGFTIASKGSADQFTQELKLTGGLGDRIDYVTGAFYFRESNRASFADVFTSAATAVPALLADRLLRNSAEAWAGYAQADFHVSPAITATAGIRYTREDKDVSVTDLRDARVQPVLNGISQRLETANVRAFGVPTDQSTKQWTPRFALNYRPMEDALLFASATRGFRSGGWNARSTSANLFLPFGPEKVWSYELGAKAEWLDRRLRTNVTLFQVEAKDFQVPAAFVNPQTGALTFISGNFAGLENRGVELELQAVPVEGLNVYLTAGFQDAKYVDVSATTLAQQGRCQTYLAGGGPPLPGVQGCGQGLVTVTGGIATPVRAPDFTGSAGGSYAWSLGTTGLRLVPSVNVTYTSEQETGVTNLSLYSDNGVGNAIGNGTFVAGSYSEAHWVTSAALALEPDDGRWRLSAECSNCFDVDFVESTTSNYSYLNPLGQWMVRFRYRFAAR